MGQEGFAEIGEADAASEAVEKARAEFVFELEDLLGERRLGDVRLFGSPREGKSFGDGTKVTKLVEFHRTVSRRKRHAKATWRCCRAFPRFRL